MIHHVSWETQTFRNIWSSSSGTYSKKELTGKVVLCYLDSRKDAADLKNLAVIKDTKFKGRFGLRKGPLLVLFVQKDIQSSKFKDAPVVMDDYFIRKWSGGLLQGINDIKNVEQLFYIALKGKYKCKDSFKAMLNTWIKTHLNKKS